MLLLHSFTLICSYSHGQIPKLSIFCFSLVSPQPVLTGPDLAYIGSSVMFRCHLPLVSLDSLPPIKYELQRDGIPFKMRIVYKGNQSVLFFLKVTAESEASYRCEVTREKIKEPSNSIRLRVVGECHYLPTTSDSLSKPDLSHHSSATVKHQGVFQTLPARCVRGVTLRAELRRLPRLQPVLHLVFQQA